MFRREEIIFRSKFIYNFFWLSQVSNVKLSELISRHDFLDTQKTWIKIFNYVSNTGILTQLNYNLCQTDNNLTFLWRDIQSLYDWLLQQVSHNKYWEKLLKNTSHQDKSRILYQGGKIVPQISSKLICYYVG